MKAFSLGFSWDAFRTASRHPQTIYSAHGYLQQGNDCWRRIFRTRVSFGPTRHSAGRRLTRDLA
ncbi:MAG: hypothetical protein HKN82_04635 [Akkermansiaceae bacterium]|nr:hypothetical protein [Akkermansiaceae bacterium]NNM30763.1 hypothetical protein [Akkermansiaceae bacterium]